MSITKHLARGAVLAGAALALVPAAAAAAPPGFPPPPGGGPGIPIPNIPPHAEFTANPNPAVIGRLPGRPNTLPILGARVDLNASGSYDLGGSIVKYEWDRDGDGTYEVDGGTRSSRPVIFTTPGAHTVRLRVTDNRRARSTATRTIVVHRRPVARLAGSPGVALLGESVNWSGAASTDDGSIAKYEFDLDNDGTYEIDNGASPNLARSYGGVGVRTVRLRVTDNLGATATTNAQVDVHRSPTASLSIAPSPAVVGQAVTFDGSGSSDDAPLAKYEFDLDGNGSYETNSGASPTATTTYATAQTLTVRMRVTDSHGVTDVTSRSLTVNEPPLTPRDTTGPAVSIATSSVRASRGGAVKVKVSCPAGEAAGCAGKVKLSKLGSAPFAVSAGRTKKVVVQLSAKKLRRLKRNGSIASTATVKATDQAGNTTVARKAITVKAPKR